MTFYALNIFVCLLLILLWMPFHKNKKIYTFKKKKKPCMKRQTLFILGKIN